jgi:hypothetical protein
LDGTEDPPLLTGQPYFAQRPRLRKRAPGAISDHRYEVSGIGENDFALVGLRVAWGDPKLFAITVAAESLFRIFLDYLLRACRSLRMENGGLTPPLLTTTSGGANLTAVSASNLPFLRFAFYCHAGHLTVK